MRFHRRRKKESIAEILKLAEIKKGVKGSRGQGVKKKK